MHSRDADARVIVCHNVTKIISSRYTRQAVLKRVDVFGVIRAYGNGVDHRVVISYVLGAMTVINTNPSFGKSRGKLRAHSVRAADPIPQLVGYMRKRRHIYSAYTYKIYALAVLKHLCYTLRSVVCIINRHFSIFSPFSNGKIHIDFARLHKKILKRLYNCQINSV